MKVSGISTRGKYRGEKVYTGLYSGPMKPQREGEREREKALSSFTLSPTSFTLAAGRGPAG